MCPGKATHPSIVCTIDRMRATVKSQQEIADRFRHKELGSYILCTFDDTDATNWNVVLVVLERARKKRVTKCCITIVRTAVKTAHHPANYRSTFPRRVTPRVEGTRNIRGGSFSRKHSLLGNQLDMWEEPRNERALEIYQSKQGLCVHPSGDVGFNLWTEVYGHCRLCGRLYVISASV